MPFEKVETQQVDFPALEREVLARPHGSSGFLVVLAAFALASAAAFAWFRLSGGGSGDEGASE